MVTHIREQETTFYVELQNCSGLDLRDNRGLIHDLAFVLLGLIIGLLRNRDGNLSSLHRSMVNIHEDLCRLLGFDIEGVISRPHLPRILKKVALKKFEALVYEWFKIELSDTEKKWFAADGKELRGSIEKGKKRGEARVQLVAHKEKTVQCNSYYNGTKESEKVCLQELIVAERLTDQKISADALHLSPAMTAPIEAANGVFLIGLKGNQKELLQDMKDHVDCFSAIQKYRSVDKGHGRLEQRYYQLYDISEEYFAPRWKATSFRSLIVVDRERIDLKNNSLQCKRAYYISNGKAERNNEYFEAIRNHWEVETNHHIRDVTLKEDSLKTKKNEVTRVFSGLRTLAIEILRLLKPKSMIAQIELFQDDLTELIRVLKMLKFL